MLRRVLLFATPRDCSPPNPLSMEFSRQEYWSGLPFPTPGNLPDAGIKPASPPSPALAGGFFTIEPPWETLVGFRCEEGFLIMTVPCLLPCFYYSLLPAFQYSRVSNIFRVPHSSPYLPDGHPYTDLDVEAGKRDLVKVMGMRLESKLLTPTPTPLQSVAALLTPQAQCSHYVPGAKNGEETDRLALVCLFTLP